MKNRPFSVLVFSSTHLLAAAFAIAALFASPSAFANTENDVLLPATNLSIAASYSSTLLPTSTNDVTFTNATYTIPGGFTVGAASLSMGTLNDLNTSQSIVIGNNSTATAYTITLNGGSNSVAPLNGGAAGDLIFVAGSGNMTIQNTQLSGNKTLGVVLASAGNFDVGSSGLLTISSIVSGNFSLTKTGTGTLFLSGANTFGSAATTFTIGAGTVQLGAATLSLGAAANKVSVTGGASLDLNGKVFTTANALTINGQMSSTVGAVTNSSATAGSYAGTVAMASDSSIGGSAGDMTFSGIVSGNFNLTKVGSDTLILSNTANTFGSGTTTFTISAGTVKLGAATTSLGVAANSVSVSNNATLDLNGKAYTTLNALTINGQFSSTVGALTNSSATAGSYNGTVTMGSDSSIGGSSGNLTIGGIVSGNYNLTKVGTGTMIFGNVTNTFGAGKLFTIGAGTVQLGNVGSLGDATGAVSVSGGAALDLNGKAVANTNALTINGQFSSTVGALTNNSATAGSYNGTVTMASDSSIGGSNGTLTIGGVLSGGFNLTKVGSNTLTLGNANIYSGTTTISQGTVSTGSIVVGGGTSGLGNASSAVVLGGAATKGTLSYTGSTNTFTRGISLNAGGGELDVITAGQTVTIDTAGVTGTGLFTIGGAGNVTVNSAISSSGGLTIATTGNGTVTLASSNSYTGTTTLSGAAATTTIVNGNNSFGNGASPISWSGGIVQNGTGGALALANNITILGTDYISSTGQNVTLNGTLTVSGANRSLRMANVTGGAVLTIAGNIYLSDSSSAGYQLDLTGTSGINNTTVSGIIANFNGGSGTAGNLSITAGQATLTGNNTYTGQTTISGSGAAAFITSFGSPGTPGNLGEGTLIQAYGTIYYTGTGETTGKQIDMYSSGKGMTVDTTGATGGVILTGGVTSSIATTHILTLTGNTTGNGESGAIVDGIGTGTSVVKSGTGTWQLSGPNTFTGNTTINAGTLSVSILNSVSGGVSSSSLGAPTTVANGTINFGSNAANVSTLLYTGTGETTDRVINLGETATGAAVTIDQSGTGLLNFTSPVTATGAANTTLTLQGSTSGTGQIAAIPNNSAHITSLVKAGTGTWALSGNNTYTGTTTVSLGTLLINGNSNAGATGNMAVAANAVLGGTGTLGGNLTVAANGILSGGDGTTGTALTSGKNITLSAGAVIELTLGDLSAHSSLVRNAAGTWVFDSLQKFKFADLGATAGMTYSGLITGLGADPGSTGSWTITNSGWSGNFTYNGGTNSVDLLLNTVPEPATWGLLAFSLTTVLVLRRRRS